jgi:hypothetical protein
MGALVVGKPETIRVMTEGDAFLPHIAAVVAFNSASNEESTEDNIFKGYVSSYNWYCSSILVWKELRFRNCK